MLYKFDIKNFDCIYKIMESSFISDEYRTYDEQKALLDNPVYTIYTKQIQSKIIGFFAVWEFDDFDYIDHFAIDLDYRGQGYGSEMLDELLSMYKKMVVLEVEPPDTEISQKRIEFYKQHGFYLNTYPYIQPPISNCKKPVPLFIMSTVNYLSIDNYNRVKSILYKDVYKYILD